MASIYKRKNRNGSSVWRAVIRIKGYPTVCETFSRKQEAEDWAHDQERTIKSGQYKFDQYKKQQTFQELFDRFLSDGALEHHKSKDDTLRHLYYWCERFASYALVHITPELIGKERQLLLTTPTPQKKSRSPATINRYLASLSSLFSYAVKQLRWITESPCQYLKKLKEDNVRDRVLAPEEITSLLSACRQSSSPYLYCIVLISITTGARQGELLSLKWQDIDFDHCLAFLKETKNGSPRSIFLVPPVMEELKKLHAKRDKTKEHVFASKTAFGKVDIKKPWQKALSSAGITNYRFHDMRHCFATLAASQGASNLELSAALGHKTLEMLQRYTHLNVRMTKKYSEGISKQILQGANL